MAHFVAAPFPFACSSWSFISLNEFTRCRVVFPFALWLVMSRERSSMIALAENFCGALFVCISIIYLDAWF